MDNRMMDVKQRKKLVVICSWAAVILWMTLIFLSSAQTARVSGANSKAIVTKLVKVAEQTKLAEPGRSTDPRLLGELDHYFRKCMHATVYFILALLVVNALYRSDVKGKKRYALSLLICVIYAGSDEFHQLFVPGRGAQVRDVLIDSSGAVVGICIFWIRALRKKKQKV